MEENMTKLAKLIEIGARCLAITGDLKPSRTFEVPAITRARMLGGSNACDRIVLVVSAPVRHAGRDRRRFAGNSQLQNGMTVPNWQPGLASRRVPGL
jgi:hypothetical protein